jgi:hypothetical protein
MKRFGLFMLLYLSLRIAALIAAEVFNETEAYGVATIALCLLCAHVVGLGSTVKGNEEK